MNQITKYKQNINIPLTIFFIIIILIMGFFGIKLLKNPKDESEFLLGVILCIVFAITIISVPIGILKGNIEIKKEQKFIKETNPFDSKIENTKDIVAILLDLCAKNYFKLIKKDNKYIIKVLSTDDSKLLKNEIMKTGYDQLINNSSFQIDNINNITFDNIEIEN